MNLKKKISYSLGYIKVKPTTNNVFITITNLKGKVLVSSHVGIITKTNKKNMSLEAASLIPEIVEKLKNLNISIKLFILQYTGINNNKTPMGDI